MAVDPAVLERLVRDHAVEVAVRLADRFVEEVQGNAPRRTGTLADSVQAHPPVVFPDVITITVDVTATNDDGVEYGRWVDEGTGIYGPEGVPIRAKHLRRGGLPGFMVFDWPGVKGGIVFALEVQGSEPTRFWSKAVAAWPNIVARVANGG